MLVVSKALVVWVMPLTPGRRRELVVTTAAAVEVMVARAVPGETAGSMVARRRDARVVVADDQTVVREGIVMLLGLLPGIEVVGAAADGLEAVRLVGEHAPDVVLMDLRMPRCDGVEATRRIRTEYPATQVVVLTTFADDDSLFPALQAGARGYLTKDARRGRDRTRGRACDVGPGRAVADDSTAAAGAAVRVGWAEAARRAWPSPGCCRTG
ncbi:hypothetical protein GCM10020000_20490 [Streptomyces olivoverticillatus]